MPLRTRVLATGALATALLAVAACGGQGPAGGGTAELTFAYEGPLGTGHELAAEIFEDSLDEVSNGAFELQMFPAAQLGGEPALLESVRSGDIDFVLSSTANAAAIAPESGVLSLHYLFDGPDDVIATVGSPEVNEAYQAMAAERVQGARPLTLFTLDLRNMYGDSPVRSVQDLQGSAVRVQATATEDTIFSAYGAQPVHMAFPELYTALQTGTVDAAENAVTYYGLNRHYEVAPVMSMTEHAGNVQVLWVSQRTWDGFTPEQQTAVTEAAMRVRDEQPRAAFELQQELQTEYRELGVQFVEDVDKESFRQRSVPLQDQVAEGLGPHAVTILDAVRSVTRNG
ncbi:TRAP transporter substrate-binding protein [Pseudonocardia sp. MH-G8]|uniref:TRAP transporter substrate-binding protein n=1 Tax=Pseudonocardia sp. MH-G8 TaxID=1854588 RepID=UPI000BA039AD|nr:TRAP transporter substrate-binding protein [Pseudonocardia sp. MH-G8]OZM77921.1 C4-dicarboxylate ABC transporter substrate-binding protein [Pseudonocardia sp. MH-G8]